MAAPAVRLDDLQLTVVPGEGLVARFGEVALLALSGGSGAAVDQLLATCRALGSARIDEPGAILVDQLDALLGERMPASPSFCVLATSAEGVEVVLCGEVEVTVARGGQVSRHAGPDPDTWVDLLVDEGFDWLVAVPLGSAEPASDVRLDLHDGVVPGGGLRLTQRDRLPGESGRRPRDHGARGRGGHGSAVADAEPGRAPSLEPGREPRRLRVRTALAGALGRLRPSPLPVATTSLDDPIPAPDAILVAALRCSAGHPNNPAASHCGHCGRSLLDGTARLVDRPQPSLGLLLLDDGSAYALDTGYLIGSNPDLAKLVVARRRTSTRAARGRRRRSHARRGRARRMERHRGRSCTRRGHLDSQTRRPRMDASRAVRDPTRSSPRHRSGSVSVCSTFVAVRRVSGVEPPR